MGHSLIMSDEQLHHLGELYLANPMLAARNVTFEMFLYNPGALLVRITELQLDQVQQSMNELDEYLELLPQQQAVQQRLDESLAVVDLTDIEPEQIPATGPKAVKVRNNGHLVEPLVHTRYPARRWQRSSFGGGR